MTTDYEQLRAKRQAALNDDERTEYVTAYAEAGLSGRWLSWSTDCETTPGSPKPSSHDGWAQPNHQSRESKPVATRPRSICWTGSAERWARH